MSDFSKNILQTLSKEEPFISGRRSCKGCSKALAARIAAKAIADTSMISKDLMPGISQQLASFSSQSYEYNPAAATGIIKKFLSTVDDINTASGQENGSANGTGQKSVIGIDRNVLMDDYLALAEVVAQSKNTLYICFDNEPHMTALIKKAIPKPFILNENHMPVTDQDVLEVMFVILCPKMPVFGCMDHLCGDSHPVSYKQNRAFYHCIDIQLPGYYRH